MFTISAMADILAQAPGQQPASPLFMIGIFVIMFAFMYLFTIRPQRIKEKKHMEQVSKLKKDDEVMLDGGIYGSIHSVEQDSMLVKIADKCIIKVHQRGVRVILKNESAPAAASDK